MNTGTHAARLSGNRLHLQHGPIDLLIKAEGQSSSIESAYQRAEARFQTILSELVGELNLLRCKTSLSAKPASPVAMRMWDATILFSSYFVTPMAAVAGSVADEILQTMLQGSPRLTKVFVNNGGDIALWKDTEEVFTIEVVTQPAQKLFSQSSPVTLNINKNSHVGGVATSGRYGRSFSLGIADSVTVLASNAAIADAAATLIASSINIESEKIIRQPASEIEPDSDLGDKMVCVDVGKLSEEESIEALDKGVRMANGLLDEGHITGVFIFLQNQYVCIPDNAEAMCIINRESDPLALMSA